jgi:hypothetical protein
VARGYSGWREQPPTRGDAPLEWGVSLVMRSKQPFRAGAVLDWAVIRGLSGVFPRSALDDPVSSGQAEETRPPSAVHVLSPS